MIPEPRILIVGLDGATFDVLDRLRTQVHCPTLEQLIDEGARGILDSTRPIATLPAWTSFLTTASPAQHGIADIFLRLPQSNRIEPASGIHRGGSTWLYDLASAGYQVGAFGFPGTYPAECHPNLIQISGFDTPDAQARGRGVSPAKLQSHIESLGGWHFSILPEDRKGGLDPDTCADALIKDLGIKTRIIEDLQASKPLNILAWHIQPSDTIAHHGWASWDRDSPRAISYQETDAFQRVFQAIDRSVERVMQSYGPTHVMIVSDHGFGGAGRDVFYLNRFLAQEGYLHLPESKSHKALLKRGFFELGNQFRAHFPKASKRALGVLAGVLHPKIFAGLRGQDLNLEGALAFSDELDYAPSIWLNRKSSFTHGHLSDAEADSMVDELATKLRTIRLPHHPVPLFKDVWCRPTNKPFSNRIPDIVLEPNFINGYRPSFLSSNGSGPTYRELEPSELRAGRGYGMPGVHHADGVLVLWGQSWPNVDLPKLNIADAGALILGLLGHPIPSWSDWEAPQELKDWKCWPARESAPPDSFEHRDDIEHRMPPEVWARLKQWGYVN